MILILLNIVVNGYLLFYMAVLTLTVTGLIHKMPPHISVNEFAGLCYGLTIFVTVFGLTSFGEYIVRLFLNVRKAVGRELNQVSPLIEEVLVNGNNVYSQKFNIKKVKLYVADKKYSNAQAFGRNTIVLTRGLLKSASEEELKAVIAHEIGHLYYKDSIALLTLLFSNFVIIFTLFCFLLYVFVYNVLINALSDSPGAGTMGIVHMIIFLFFLPGLLIYKLMQWLLLFSLMFLSHRCEYKADKFAASLGYRDGLISFLEKIEASEEPDNSILGRIFASHPPSMKRIDRLEDKI